MFKQIAIALPAFLLVSGAAAQDAPPPGGEEVSIPFITNGNIRTFQSTTYGDGVYIQNSHRDWYFVRFGARCQELPWAIRIGVKTFGGGSMLERGDTILVDHDRCMITSIVRSGPPPKKAKKPKRDS